MKKETGILLLLFFSPALGELLSGSAPPLVFFNPVALLILILFWIPLAFVSEFGDTQNPDPTTGMSIVGIFFLCLLVVWRRRVRKEHDAVLEG